MQIHIRSMAVFLVAGIVGCANGGGQQSADGRWETRKIAIHPPKQPPAPPKVHIESTDPALQTAAKAELNNTLASNDGFIRAHAIEAIQNTLGLAAKPIYLNGLKDTEPQVRYASAMAIGTLQIAEAMPQLEQMLNDNSAHVGIAVRFALHRLGNTANSKELEVTARDPQWQIRATTAVVLGLLNEPTAVRVLLPMLRDTEAPVRLQAAEALYRLGNEKGQQALVAGLSSAFADDQMIALIGLAGPRDRRVLGHLRGLLTIDYDYGDKRKGPSAEVGLVAARACGMVGSDMGYVIAVEGTKSDDPRQRSLGALALGAIGRSDAQGYLGELLKDKGSADVRLSAAQAILQLKTPTGSTARGE